MQPVQIHAASCTNSHALTCCEATRASAADALAVTSQGSESRALDTNPSCSHGVVSGRSLRVTHHSFQRFVSRKVNVADDLGHHIILNEDENHTHPFP